jgi:hypothetical protein
MQKSSLGTKVVVATCILVVALSACTGWGQSESDAVRRAVISHELDETGVQVDELIIRLSPGEFRADLGRGTRIVWLVSPGYQRKYVEAEYFRVRDPERSYLFLQDITYDESQDRATVEVVLYLGSGGPTTKELTLHKDGDSWQIGSETLLETREPGQ